MSNQDYIPATDAKFDEWQLNFRNYGSTRYDTWGIPTQMWTDNGILQADFAAKYALAINPLTRTSITILQKNESKAIYIEDLRRIIRSHITYNEAVSDADRQALGVPVHKTDRAPSPVAADSPDNDVDTSVPAHVTFRYFERGSDHKRAKPAGQHGVELLWLISDVAPTDWSELTNSSFSTRPPLTLSFDNHQRGKTLYYALRWENTRGQKGPWSLIQSTIIP